MIYKISLQAIPTSNLFEVGHRIRLDIAGSSFPHLNINPSAD